MCSEKISRIWGLIVRKNCGVGVCGISPVKVSCGSGSGSVMIVVLYVFLKKNKYNRAFVEWVCFGGHAGLVAG